jgi:hypothetical protein
LTGCLAASGASGTPTNCDPSPLRGTFIQPINAQAAWSRSDWLRLFSEFKALTIRNLFLQWTVLNHTAFFPTGRYKSSSVATLRVTMNFAAETKIQVWTGLHLDTQHWEEIRQGADRVRWYFRERLQDLNTLLPDLDRTVAEDPFAGWYITDEIDDQTWQEDAKLAVLKQYLSQTVAQLKSRRPGSKVAISGFTNSRSDPDVVAAFWADVLKGSDIDLLLFQEGIGEHKLGLAELPRYYSALLDTVRGMGLGLGAVVELFNLVPDGGRVPGSVARIRTQLAIADRLSTFPPVAFAIPNYMSELAGTQAAALFSDFVSAHGICPQ